MYSLRIHPDAEKSVKKVAQSGQVQVKKKLKRLLENPRFYGDPLSADLKGLYKARAGGYRILYFIDELNKEVVVTEIGPRASVYDNAELPDIEI